ncbi:MAG: hypothetical protein ACRDH5_15005, partial [bacterium]
MASAEDMRGWRQDVAGFVGCPSGPLGVFLPTRARWAAWASSFHVATWPPKPRRSWKVRLQAGQAWVPIMANYNGRAEYFGGKPGSFGLQKESSKGAGEPASKSRDVKTLKAGPRGRFLTQRDRNLLLEGPEPKRKTRLQYRGDRVDAERRAYKVAYARVLREAQRDARGALEDLWFLAKTVMDKEWLLGAVAETRPLQGSMARALSKALGGG